MLDMDALEFNYCIRYKKTDPEAFNKFYEYCVVKMRSYIWQRFGRSNYYDEVPHDVLTTFVIEKPPDEFIRNPKSWLYRIVINYVLAKKRLKDNNTLELLDGYIYYPDYDILLDDEELLKSEEWLSLDDESRYIVYLNGVDKFKLKDIAYILGKKPTYVRTKKSRAIKILKRFREKMK